MKIKDVFKKVEGFNEFAELLNADKAVVWFGDKIGQIRNGYNISNYETFRKHVRHEYFKDIADFILNDDGWQINSEREYTNVHGRSMVFELYIEQV